MEEFYEEIWNRHDKSRLSALLQPDFSFRGSLGATQTGREGFASYVDSVHEALGSYRCDVLDLVAENQQAAARMRFSGVHRGELLGFAPTGKPVEWLGAAFFTFSGGKIADLWVLGDLRGLSSLLERQANE